MKAANVLRWSIPSILLIAGSALAASPTLDGVRDSSYVGALSSQESSVIQIFSPPFAVEINSDNSNVGGVGALAATNFKGEPGDVTTGFELSLPLNEIGWDGSSDIKICAFVNGSGADFLSNQVSGGLPTGTTAGDGGQIGAAPFDFTGSPDFDGNQYVTVTSVQGSASLTIDGVANEPEWTGTTIYTNGIAASPGTENPTSFADNNDSTVATANGSEIDAIRAFRTGNTLYVHIAGNLETNYNKLEVFLDTSTSGANQNPLPGTPNPNWASTAPLAGSVFDTVFAPDYYLRYNSDASNAYLDAVELGNAGAYVGPVAPGTQLVLTPGPGAGGTITATMDNSNTVGITGPGGGDGTDVAVVSAPSGVSTGCEFSVDLDALGWNGTDPVKIGGFLAEGDQMSNQVIGGLPSDTGQLGPADGLDFNTIAGDQYVTISMSPAGTAPTIDGVLDGGLYTALYVNDASSTGNSTSLGDATSGGGPDVDPMASEIDGLYATIVNDGSGNKLYCLVSGNFGNYNKLGVFFDAAPGGQNTIRNDNPDVSGNFYNNLSPMVWDTGFEPDFSIVYNLGTNNGPDAMPGTADDFVEHFCDAVQLTTNGAEDQPAGGPIGGGPKSSTNLSGNLVSRTGFGNNSLTDGLYANGSEYDNISAYVDSTFLYIFIGGNLETNFTKGEIFLDVIPYDANSQTGGQNTLVYDADPVTIEDPPGSGTFVPNPDYTGNPDLDFQALNREGGPWPIPGTDPQEFQPGLTFDSGFTADYWIYFTAGGDDPLFPGEPEWYGGIERLYGALRHSPASTADPDIGEAHFWGGTSYSDFGDFIDTPGETAGLYIDNSNDLGVAGGPDQYEPDDSAPSTVATGIEIRVPLEQILVNDPVNPDTAAPVQWDGQSTFKITAFINGGFHSYISNQFLQPICDTELGEPRLVNLETDEAGLQYLTLVPHGVGTAYTNSSSSPPACIEPVGACCVNQVCTENVLLGDCTTMGGTFLGDGSDCSAGCPAPTGACCLAGGNCAIFDEATCTGAGGTYQGDGTDCGSVSCPTGGACCYACPDGNTCVDVTDLAGCQAAGGLYAGDGTDCGTFTCSTLCVGDLNGDGLENVFDFGTFATNFGTTSGATRCDGDFNCDGAVNVFDFGNFATNFGCNGPATGSCP